MPCHYDKEKRGWSCPANVFGAAGQGRPNHLTLGHDRVRWPSPPAPYKYQGRGTIREGENDFEKNKEVTEGGNEKRGDGLGRERLFLKPERRKNERQGDFERRLFLREKK